MSNGEMIILYRVVYTAIRRVRTAAAFGVMIAQIVFSPLPSVVFITIIVIIFLLRVALHSDRLDVHIGYHEERTAVETSRKENLYYSVDIFTT